MMCFDALVKDFMQHFAAQIPANTAARDLDVRPGNFASLVIDNGEIMGILNPSVMVQMMQIIPQPNQVRDLNLIPIEKIAYLSASNRMEDAFPLLENHIYVIVIDDQRHPIGYLDDSALLRWEAWCAGESYTIDAYIFDGIHLDGFPHIQIHTTQPAVPRIHVVNGTIDWGDRHFQATLLKRYPLDDAKTHFAYIFYSKNLLQGYKWVSITDRLLETAEYDTIHLDLMRAYEWYERGLLELYGAG